MLCRSDLNFCLSSASSAASLYLEPVRKLHAVQCGRGENQTVAVALVAQKIVVEAAVVRDYQAALQQGEYCGDVSGEVGCIGNHFVADACQVINLKGGRRIKYPPNNFFLCCLKGYDNETHLN